MNVASPNGAIALRLVPGADKLNYEVTSHFAPVIERSEFVFTIDGDNVAAGSTITKIEHYSANTKYPTRGVHSLAINHFNGSRFTLRHKNRDYILDVRAFDDAVAFRFIAPGNPGEQRTPDELTTFTLPMDSTLWSHDLNGHYEGTPKQQELAAVKQSTWAAPPLTIKLPRRDGYVSITEANLFDYAGMALEANEHHGYTIGLGHRQPVSYPYKLRYSKEDVERLSHPAVITGTITTPWRVVLIGKDLNTLVNSDAITNLCPPPDKTLFPQGMATDWIKPGRAVWRYLDGGITANDRPATTSASSQPSQRRGTPPAEAEAFSDAAGKLGFQYNVLEDFWSLLDAGATSRSLRLFTPARRRHLDLETLERSSHRRRAPSPLENLPRRRRRRREDRLFRSRGQRSHRSLRHPPPRSRRESSAARFPRAPTNPPANGAPGRTSSPAKLSAAWNPPA